MVASKIVSSSGFCWADEVEKEEEEEKDFRHSRRRRERSRSRSPSREKPNPFGSARPREVVLEEKGIDWRKHDSTPRKEKHLSENVPAPSGPSGGKKRWSPRTRDLESDMENTRLGWAKESGISSGSLTYPDQNVDSLVPPLQYPPKNIAVLMKEKLWPEYFYKAKASLSSSKEFHGEKHRENMIPEFERQLDYKRLDSSFRAPHRHRYSNLHDRETEWDKEKPRTENRDNFTVKEFGHQTRGEMRREKSPLVHREKEWKRMNHHPSERHLIDDERLPVEERRGTHHESWDDGGYEYGRTSGAREKLRRSPSIDEPSNREGLRDRPYNKEVTFRGNYRNVGARPLEERGNGNMDYFSGRQRFDTKEFEGPHTGRMDRGRAENHRDMNMDKAGFRRNDRNNIGGNYNNVGVRPLDERRTEKMEHLYGRQRFDGREFDGSRTRSMDRGRPEYYPDMDTDRADFGRNYRKRSMEPRPNTSRGFQRRRK